MEHLLLALHTHTTIVLHSQMKSLGYHRCNKLLGWGPKALWVVQG